jgi:hypothetical protein
VIDDPRITFDALAAFLDNTQHVVDLQPTEYKMKMRRARYVSPTSVAKGHLSEPPKEQKNISDADALLDEMALRAAGLTQCRPPVAAMSAGFAVQIGIEVDHRFCVPTAATQVRSHLANIDVDGAQIPERVGIVSRRNRQWNQPPIREDRTRHPTIRGVESFPAQD